MSGFLDNAGQVVVLVAAAAVTDGSGYWFKHRNDVNDQLKMIISTLITEDPTPFNPFPQKKLIDQMIDNSKETKENREAILALTVRVSQSTDTTNNVLDELKKAGP